MEENTNEVKKDEKVTKNKGKKIIIIVVLTLLILFGLRIPMGFIKFGTDLCEGHRPMSSLTVMSSYVCQICLTPHKHGSSDTPLICDTCAFLTRRCPDCGKLDIGQKKNASSIDNFIGL